ncbi:MAG: class I SAM-dependent methyltransferase [Candidatus Omnitrophica bacterium]|nr:class I SAM-dependent methyltransferase [Candidatus Omnitrophota bacterium]
MQTTEIRKRYDTDYRDKKFGGEDYTHRWILNILRPKSGMRLLDIGCSQGYLLMEAERLGLSTHGIEISSEAAKLARKRSRSSQIFCGDAHTLPWNDGFFDYITAIGCLEHFNDPQKCLREIRRVMKDGGRACIMVPNLLYYRYVINKFLYATEPTSYQAIERFAPLHEWAAFIEGEGLDVVKVHKYNKFNRPVWQVLFRSIVVPLKLSHHFVFICKKKDSRRGV